MGKCVEKWGVKWYDVTMGVVALERGGGNENIKAV